MDDASLVRVGALLAGGATQAEVRRTTSALTRLAKGAYCDLTDLDQPSVHRLRMSAVLTRVSSVCVSHTSAALLWDLPLRATDLSLVHLSALAGRRGNPKAGDGYHVHCQQVPDRSLTTIGDIPVTAPLRTVLDSATVLPRDWAVVVADAALHRGMISPTVLAETATRIRRIKGAQRVRALPDLCSGLAESPGESLLRLRLRRMGLLPAEQVSMPTIEGRPRVDFLIEDRLVIEFDGRAKYGIDGDPEQAHWQEKLRHDRLTEAGYTVLRVTWAELWDEAALARRVNRVHRR